MFSLECHRILGVCVDVFAGLFSTESVAYEMLMPLIAHLL